jgi:hypothetical protein
MCEVLGLFVLLLVGIMLTSKSGHPVFSGCEIDFMSRAVFYFVPFTVMLVDVVQRRCQRKIMAQVTARSAGHLAAARCNLHLYVEIPYVTSQPNQFLLAALLNQTVWEKVGDG